MRERTGTVMMLLLVASLLVTVSLWLLRDIEDDDPRGPRVPAPDPVTDPGEDPFAGSPRLEPEIAAAMRSRADA